MQDSAERSPKPSVCPQQKQECSLPVLDFDNSSREVRVRRTLLSLFRLDDGVDAENATKNQEQVEDGSSGTNYISETRSSGSGIVLKSKFSAEHLILETQASSSHSVAGDASFTARRKHGSLADENLKERSLILVGFGFCEKSNEIEDQKFFQEPFNAGKELDWGNWGERVRDQVQS